MSNEHIDLAGPEKTRTSGKVEKTLSPLRDINVCQVRPNDLITHQGYSVLITDRKGWIANGKNGLFFHQTRYLSRFGVAIDGAEPVTASASLVDHHASTAYHLSSTPAGADAGPKRDEGGAKPGEVAKKAIELQVSTFVGGGLHVDLILTNHAMAATEVTLGAILAADFADLNEVLAEERQQDAPVERRWDERSGVLRFRYTHPKLDLATIVRAVGGDAWFDGGERLYCRVALKPRQTRLLALDVVPIFEGVEVAPLFGVDGSFDEAATAAVARRTWAEGRMRLIASNPAVQRAWEQAESDLASLQIGEGSGQQPAMIVAGMPNYTGLFGRDAYMTALQSALLSPTTLRGALEVLTPLNAAETDDFRDAQPGKVLHQQQKGPLARLGLSPFLRYYGDQSAPGLFLLAAAKHFAHTGDAPFLRSLQTSLVGTLDWMDGNRDGEGFYPYQTRSSMGVRNQSWKDSGEAVLYPDGDIVETPIAMADIQAVFYAGQQSLGLAFAALGEDELATRLTDMAAELKRRFNARYWMPEESYYAIALDPAHQQVRSIASDPGACLAYGIVDEDKAAAVADRLMRPDMFSGWGIRTLSAEHVAYNPFAYHLGTVWPSPNAVTAFGFRRYGFHEHLHRLVRAQFDAAQIFDLDRLPEVFGGHARDARHPHPGLYPGACSPQAWSAGAVVLLIESLAGITPVACRNTLLVDPALPDWLPELTLSGIAVGKRRATVKLRRDGSGHTECDVLDDGGLRIVRPEPLPPGRDRLAAALGTLACGDKSIEHA